MQKITYSDALTALNEAVAKRGYGHVDERSKIGATCQNVIQKPGSDDYEPSCIVGTALVWLGVPVEWFVNQGCYSSSATIVADRLLKDELFEIDERALDLFVVAQGEQDGAKNWGDAVLIAHLGKKAFDALEPRH